MPPAKPWGATPKDLPDHDDADLLHAGLQEQLERNIFEIAITPKRLRWDWCVRDLSGKVMMRGRERSRAEARYQSGRALFLLLLTTCPRFKPA